jgi:hypothetical protein
VLWVSAFVGMSEPTTSSSYSLSSLSSSSSASTWSRERDDDDDGGGGGGFGRTREEFKGHEDGMSGGSGGEHRVKSLRDEEMELIDGFIDDYKKEQTDYEDSEYARRSSIRYAAYMDAGSEKAVRYGNPVSVYVYHRLRNHRRGELTKEEEERKWKLLTYFIIVAGI